MSTNPRGIAPLNWEALVKEALRRRKAEKLTQRAHAAMANVSIPTMAAFDRGDTTLSLAKALDVLRIVGLVDDPAKENVQDVFVREAFTRWQALSANLPKDDPGRFLRGWYRFDYYLEGDLRLVELQGFEKLLGKAMKHHLGWPPFRIREDISPREVDDTIEYFWALINETPTRDAATSDFWRASPSGRMFMMRGYQEDCAENFPAGSLFDTILPIWRMGEALLHAERLASLMQKNENKPITVHFRAVYSGLSGRVLRAWANPFGNVLGEGRAARSNEAILQAHIPANGISANLTEHLYPMVALLYEKFGVTDLSKDFVQAEVKGLLNRL